MLVFKLHIVTFGNNFSIYYYYYYYYYHYYCGCPRTDNEVEELRC